MVLTTLVYVSYASHKMSADELKGLLEQSRENNAKIDVTGMLLYRDGFFIQALEGEETIIMPLYEKIAQDKRHKNIMLVYKSEIEERSFDKWAMGLSNLDEVNFDDIEGYSHFLDEGTFSPEYFEKHPNQATRLLNTFKDQTYF